MRTIHRDIVVALLFSRDGKLFQGRKDPKGGGVYSDCWHTIGGGIDEGEDKVAALVREVKEEAGIDISSYSKILIDDEGTGVAEKILKDTGEKVLCEMKFNVYKVVITDKDAKDIPVTLSDDLVEYQWVTIDELKNLKLTPPSAEFFAKRGYSWI